MSDTGNAVMHMAAMEESAAKLIESCAEQKERITIHEAARRTVDHHYPLDTDPYEAWGMWIERLQQFGDLHCEESFANRVDEFGGSEFTGYERLQALVRTLVWPPWSCSGASRTTRSIRRPGLKPPRNNNSHV